ncbi:MAG: ferritin family protein [Candidatus Bipolaricaulia bacterium]
MDREKFSRLINLAITKEVEAAQFYEELTASAQRPEMREVFQEFAAQEWGHKRRLEELKIDDITKEALRPVPDLRISEYLVDVEPHSGMSFQEALVVAIKREESALKLYTDLAAQFSDPMKKLFQFLANEEAKHKNRLEMIYDEEVLG